MVDGPQKVGELMPALSTMPNAGIPTGWSEDNSFGELLQRFFAEEAEEPEHQSGSAEELEKAVEDEAGVTVNADHDGPWVSCMSKDGKTMYRNSNLPREVEIKGKLVDLDEELKAHEIPEWERLQRILIVFRETHGREPNDQERGVIYQQAHEEVGTPSEKKYCEENGIDWHTIQAWFRGEEAKIEKMEPKNPPPDADVKPIPHGHGELEATGDAKFNELDHPRQPDGKFGTGSGNSEPKDLTHLNALELRLSHERGYLNKAKTDKERAIRQVWIAQIEKEIAHEKSHLGLMTFPEEAIELSDEELLAELMGEGSETENKIGGDASLRLALDRASVRKFDKDGRLHIEETNVCKACISPYKGEEIPDYEELGLDPEKVYMMLRPPEELEKAFPTINGVPLMREHIPVNADDHQPWDVVGAIGTSARWAPPFIKNALTIWPAKDIEGIESKEKCELSPGYHYTADMTPGEFEGEAYDGRMTEIVFNHVAIVTEGRQGPEVVIGDDANEILWAALSRAFDRWAA
jgi:uncharacterized protein DUF2213